MSEIILSTSKDAEICIGGNALPDHKNLKNLEYDASGHLGFQKELSAQQLKNIDAVAGKEDKSNKAQDWGVENLTPDKYPSMEIVGARFDENEELMYSVAWDVYGDSGVLQSDYQQKIEKVTTITDGNSDSEYPSAKAVNTRIKEKTRWERIETVTLSQGVSEISKKLESRYKELYWVFRVPSIKPADSTIEQARSFLYVQNRIVSNDQGVVYTDNGNTWGLWFHIRSIGNYCMVQRAYYPNASVIDVNAHLIYPATMAYVLGWQPGKNIETNAMDTLKLQIASSTTGVRYFPAGTTYELWGVRA